jgi:hypothetical protein
LNKLYSIVKTLLCDDFLTIDIVKSNFSRTKKRVADHKLAMGME